MTRIAFVLTVYLTAFVNAQSTQSIAPKPADLVLHNGTIVTVDDEHGTVSAIAVNANRITAVGTNQQMRAYIGDQTRVVNLDGRLAIPGFIEGHGHFVGLGRAKMNLDLAVARNWNDVIAIVKDAVDKSTPGEWIVGRGWHQEKWNTTPERNVEGFPTHHDLSAISPDNPVLLTHASGHAAFANAKAMELAGISVGTLDPAGGDILRDEDNIPIGIFRETAMGLVSAARSHDQHASDAKSVDRAIDLAVTDCLRNGVTTFCDAGSTFNVIDAVKRRSDSGTLGVRVWMMVREPNERLNQRLSDYDDINRVNGRFTLGGIKVSLDGALGARGAWLLEPYADSQTSTGLNLVTMESLEQTANLALQHDLQFCVHAIGDRANREVLDLYERLFDGKKSDNRWRIEHAQHIHPDDIPRLGELDVIPAMQGIHCTSDAPWVLKRLGEERARSGAYMWRDLLDSGAIIANGTDAPVEPISPIASFHASVTRETADGRKFFQAQSMTREEALRSYTRDAAFACFEDDVKGTLRPGKLADIVVLSKNILTCPHDEILGTTVEMTILDGEVVYERPSEQ